MYYYNTLFGEKMQGIRKQIGLSRDTVAEQSGVNRDTLRRIEKGEVIPKFETLEILSPIYHTDLSQLLLECRTEDTEYLHDLMNRIERKIDDGVKLFEEEKEELKAYAEASGSVYQKKILCQWYFFLCGLAELRKDKHSVKGPLLLKKSLQQTIPDFQFENYDLFTYNEQELRILMNYAFLPPIKQNQPEYLKLLEFCDAQSNLSSLLRAKISYNLGIAYQRIGNYPMGILSLNKAIEIARENRSFQGLSRMYYEKAFAKYLSGDADYSDSLKTALILCEAHGQCELRKYFEENIRKHFHIDPEKL